MKRPMIEKIKSRLRSALNNAKYLTTGNLAHNKACVEMMVEASLNDIDQIVVETQERCIKAAQDWYCKDRCAGYNACKAKYQGKCSMTENVREQIMKGVSNEENHV